MSFFTALTNPRSTFRHLSASSMVACRCPHLIRPPASTQCSASSLTCYGFLRGPRKAERTPNYEQDSSNEGYYFTRGHRTGLYALTSFCKGLVSTRGVGLEPIFLALSAHAFLHSR
jgi:hypothetical protein